MGTATFRPRALAGGTRAGSARALNATPTLLTLRTPQRMAVRSRTRTSLTAGSPTPAYPLLNLGQRTRSSGAASQSWTTGRSRSLRLGARTPAPTPWGWATPFPPGPSKLQRAFWTVTLPLSPMVCSCWTLQASGIVAEFVDEAATAEVAEAAYSPSIVSTYPCGPSMSSFASNHCSDGGDKETGADLPGVIGNADRVNPRVASVVGGQAIFNIIAAVFADTDASTDVEADTHVNCARNLDAMFQVNEGAIIKNVDGTTYEPATEAAEIAGDMPGAVSFPTWYVAIGTDAIGLGSTGFVVPNGFCYTNACMTEFMKTVLDGDFELGKLIKDPNMANPVTSSSKCGQALTACGSAAGYQSITGNTDKWDGKEWPVPMEDYVASTDGEGNIATDAVAAGTAILPSALTNGGDDYADITAFRGPVF